MCEMERTTWLPIQCPSSRLARLIEATIAYSGAQTAALLGTGSRPDRSGLDAAEQAVRDAEAYVAQAAAVCTEFDRTHFARVVAADELATADRKTREGDALHAQALDLSEQAKDLARRVSDLAREAAALHAEAAQLRSTGERRWSKELVTVRAPVTMPASAVVGRGTLSQQHSGPLP